MTSFLQQAVEKLNPQTWLFETISKITALAKGRGTPDYPQKDLAYGAKSGNCFHLARQAQQLLGQGQLVVVEVKGQLTHSILLVDHRWIIDPSFMFLAFDLWGVEQDYSIPGRASLCNGAVIRQGVATTPQTLYKFHADSFDAEVYGKQLAYCLTQEHITSRFIFTRRLVKESMEQLVAGTRGGKLTIMGRAGTHTKSLDSDQVIRYCVEHLGFPRNQIECCLHFIAMVKKSKDTPEALV